jgi:hypothetical protein
MRSIDLGLREVELIDVHVGHYAQCVETNKSTHENKDSVSILFASDLPFCCPLLLPSSDTC